MTVLAPPEKHELLCKRPSSKEVRTRYEEEWHQLMLEGQTANVVKCLESPMDVDHQMQDLGLAEDVMLNLCNNNSLIDSWIQNEVQSRIGNIEFHSESKLQIGQTIYPFVRPLLLRYLSDKRILLASPLMSHALRIEGRGDCYDSCLNHFTECFHLKFQQLEALIPSEMNESQFNEWSYLTSLVNLEKHRQETPIEFRKVGIVKSRDPFTIKWFDQDQEEQIDLGKSPSNIAAFPEDTWLEVIVSYSRKEYQIKKILSVESIPPLADVENFKHGDLSDLPKSDWDSI